MCRLSAVLALLAIAALVHLGREREETSDVESHLLPGVVVADASAASASASGSCEDDDAGLDSLLGATTGGPRGCASYVSSGGPGRSADEVCDGALLAAASGDGKEDAAGRGESLSPRHYCRRSCGMCGTAGEGGVAGVDDGAEG